MDSDGDRMDSSVLPSSCCTEVVWDQAHHVFSIQSSSLLGPFTRFVRAPKIKVAAGEIPRGAHGLRMALAQKMFVGDQLCFEVFHTCLSQRSLLERRWLPYVDGWADGAG